VVRHYPVAGNAEVSIRHTTRYVILYIKLAYQAIRLVNLSSWCVWFSVLITSLVHFWYGISWCSLYLFFRHGVCFSIL